MHRLSRAFADYPCDLHQPFISGFVTRGFDCALISASQIENDQVLTAMRGLIRVGDDVFPFAQFRQNWLPGLRFINSHTCRDLYTFYLGVMTDDAELIVGCAKTGSQACTIR